ncbi:unnamed protein product [Pleuronectes platessa]|uniref:Uncharacterized protein n=1 Tax=Pleuronectes platessa TaxID=8262 RepID=A0A9N7VR34_PLEPL|nr:unnamed protein product [Pleuronectes platessa]
MSINHRAQCLPGFSALDSLWALFLIDIGHPTQDRREEGVRGGDGGASGLDVGLQLKTTPHRTDLRRVSEEQQRGQRLTSTCPDLQMSPPLLPPLGFNLSSRPFLNRQKSRQKKQLRVYVHCRQGWGHRSLSQTALVSLMAAPKIRRVKGDTDQRRGGKPTGKFNP